jgi:C4-dicarboxylate transporter DctM subunit
MPLWDVVKAASPWLLVMLSFLIIVTYVPQISLFLPQLLF